MTETTFISSHPVETLQTMFLHYLLKMSVKNQVICIITVRLTTKKERLPCFPFPDKLFNICFLLEINRKYGHFDIRLG
jgi:hypothetical protein